MRYVIGIVILVLLASVMSGALGLGAINRGVVPPPTGTLRLGPLTVMALPPCPSIPPPPNRWGRGCGSASPWAVWAIVRWPDGAKRQWKIVSMIVDP